MKLSSQSLHSLPCSISYQWSFFVRIEARRLGLKPMESDGETIGSAFKKGGASFVIPIGSLIALLVSGFTPAYAAVFGIIAVVGSSWLTQNPMGPRAVFEALVMGTKGMIMTAVLLCAVGLVVNVIATAGIGNTFSLMIADWAGGNLLDRNSHGGDCEPCAGHGFASDRRLYRTGNAVGPCPCGHDL